MRELSADILLDLILMGVVASITANTVMQGRC